MSRLNSIVFEIFISIIFTFILVIFAFSGDTKITYAHFFGTTKNIDDYQVIFSPSPSAPIAGDNSTVLNFSVLENNANIYNLYVAMVVTDKESGNIVGQTPYRFQEFSDITIPYVFNETGTYEVTLQTRITEDEKYQNVPLVATFDISIGNQLIPFDELMLFYVTPATVATAGIAIYLHSKKRKI